VKTLVAWLALLFHILFSLSLLALSVVGFASGPQFLHLEMFPWTGATLAWVLVGGGVLGLVTVILAIFDKVRFLFLLWALLIAAWLPKSLIFSGLRLGPDDWRHSIYLCIAALIALLGAIFLLGRKPSPGPRKYRVK
jgi:hypothetical protein